MRLDPSAVLLPPIKEAALDGSVVVVEEDGEILGCSVVFLAVHVESTWIHPAHRQRSAVGKRLLDGMRDAAAQKGVRSVWMTIVDDTVTPLILKLGGVEVSGQHFLVPFVGVAI